ncbi:MAG TPA: fibronectin type III domain-containing protein [Kofleriaceae bacterium]
MRGLASCFLLLAACSSNPTSHGDDDANTGGGGDGGHTSGDGSVANTEPEWPADSPLPAEFDFPPYANLLDASTVVVSWRTTNSTTGTVHYGTTDTYGTNAAASTADNLHHVTLSNLAPGTAYYYEVAIDGTQATRKGVFVTPGAAKWRFISFGEYHAPSESSGVAKFADNIRAFKPHVIVESGDMVDVGTDLTNWRSYMRTSAPWISNVLLMPAHSNHVNGTGGNANLKDYFVLPNNERWYLTRYGQVQFFTIDSTYDANSDVASVEVPWLNTVASEAHDGVDDPTFVIAAWHYPACSSQYASRSGVRTWVNANLVKAFRDHGGIDLILSAHDKYYERSTLTGGIVHIITNIGNISPEIPGQNFVDCTAIKTLRSNRSTALISVDGNNLSAQVIENDGTELDSFSITK